MKTMAEINAEYTKACDDYFESRYPKMISLFCEFFEDEEFEEQLTSAAEYYGKNPYQDKIDKANQIDFETLNFFESLDKYSRILEEVEFVNTEYKISLLHILMKLKTLWIVHVKGILVSPYTTKEEYKKQLFEGVKTVRKEIAHFFNFLTYALGKKPAKDEIEFMEEYLNKEA